MIATSEIRTSCLVAAKDGVPALNAIHSGFGLGERTKSQTQKGGGVKNRLNCLH